MNLTLIAIAPGATPETTPLERLQATLVEEMKKFPEAVLHDEEQIQGHALDPNAYTPVLKLQARGNRLHAGTYFGETITVPVADGADFVEHAVDVELIDAGSAWVLLLDRFEPQSSTHDRIIFTDYPDVYVVAAVVVDAPADAVVELITPEA
jgi:hypothetical protein